MTITRSVCRIIAAALMIATAATASARPVLTLHNLRADLEIVPEDRPDFAIAVEMAPASAMTDKNGAQGRAPTVTNNGEEARIESNWETAVPTFYVAVDAKDTVDIAAKKASMRKPQPRPEGLPHIRIRAPMAFSIVSNAQIFAHVGPSQSLKISDKGRGDWTIGAVAKDVDIKGYGLSDYHLASAGDASFDMFGTGNVDCGDIKSLSADLSGSGDVVVGHVAGHANVDIAGIGDVTAASIAGNTGITIMNAGGVRVLGGEMSHLLVRSIDGFGSVDMAGTVGDAEISIGTRTHVHLHRVTGKLKSSTRQEAVLKVDNP